MSQPTKVKPYTYAEVVKTYEKPDVQQDLNDACSKLAHAMSAMMDKFDAITRQMHTIDMLRRGPPLKPKWDSLRQDFAEFLWQFRSNSGIISGRFKLFHSTVLPMCTQILKPARLANRPESMQVLHSFITLSADQSAPTRTLIQRFFRLNAQFVAFLAELTNLTTRHAASAQQEMFDLSQRLSEMETHIQRIFSTTSELCTAEVLHVFYASCRLVSSSGHVGSKLTRKPVILDGDLSRIGRAYEHCERKRNEVAHAQYSSQLRQSRTDPMSIGQTMVSTFVLDHMLACEAALNMLNASWLRLRTDCNDMFGWLKNQNPSQHPVPAVIYCYAQSRSTLFAPLAAAMDAFSSGIDPSLFTAARS